MKVVVDMTMCDLHGLCVETAPEVFEIADDGELRVLNAAPPEDLRARVRDGPSSVQPGASPSKTDAPQCCDVSSSLARRSPVSVR